MIVECRILILVTILGTLVAAMLLVGADMLPLREQAMSVHMVRWERNRAEV
jgi:hypothetical protein